MTVRHHPHLFAALLAGGCVALWVLGMSLLAPADEAAVVIAFRPDRSNAAIVADVHRAGALLRDDLAAGKIWLVQRSEPGARPDHALAVVPYSWIESFVAGIGCAFGLTPNRR
ncbi:MAG: hypothetical protein EXQ85_01185 [Alphaproteobacteria bacterium]|nr:hypothetical protein [Alphaproteobacteria bacterium]